MKEKEIISEEVEETLDNNSENQTGEYLTFIDKEVHSDSKVYIFFLAISALGYAFGEATPYFGGVLAASPFVLMIYLFEEIKKDQYTKWYGKEIKEEYLEKNKVPNAFRKFGKGLLITSGLVIGLTTIHYMTNPDNQIVLGIKDLEDILETPSMYEIFRYVAAMGVASRITGTVLSIFKSYKTTINAYKEFEKNQRTRFK